MNELVKSVSIENMLRTRVAIEDRLRQAHALLIETQQIAVAAHFGGFDDHLRPRDRRGFMDRDGIDAVMKTLDAQAWQYLMNESGLMSFMDAKTRDKWREAISRREFPEMTAEAIKGTFADLYAKRAEMFEQGVINCYRRLSWDYKTNQPFKFGKRIIINYLVDRFGFANYRVTDELDDLVRVFAVIDGKPEPDHRDGMSAKVREAVRGEGKALATDYFTVKIFKKGSGHITFTRPDLVNAMNRILAKHHPHALAAQN
ncbi:MAG TPA: DUF4942 domain-containing protein [Terriglobia bacterium]|nr:DUF4942 domain-containing protein [Terriglobia bacterium]